MISAEKPDGIASHALMQALPDFRRALSLFMGFPRFAAETPAATPIVLRRRESRPECRLDFQRPNLLSAAAPKPLSRSNDSLASVARVERPALTTPPRPESGQERSSRPRPLRVRLSFDSGRIAVLQRTAASG